MNSFAVLQDDVEDDGAAVAMRSDDDASPVPDPAKPSEPAEPADRVQDPRSAREVDRPKRDLTALSGDKVANGTPAESEAGGAAVASGDSATKNDNEEGETQDGEKQEEEPQEKSLTLEEFMQQKAAMASALSSLNSRGLRQANDGQDGFKAMAVLKKEDPMEVLSGVAVKEVHESKGLKDSTHAAVANNAEIQKFFQRDPNERRPYIGRGGRGRGFGERGSGSGFRGRGSERGRGGDRPQWRGVDRPQWRGGDRGRGSGERGADRGRGMVERGGRGGDRGGDRGFDRGGDRGFDRGGDRGFDRGGDRGFDRGGDRGFDRGFERGVDRGGDRGVDRGGDRGGRGGERGMRGRGRGRPYQRDGYRPSRGDESFGGGKTVVVVPNVDDTAAFPSL